MSKRGPAAGKSGEPVPDDLVLVKRAQGGDRASLETLLRRHHESIHLLCRRICRQGTDAEDATQEALVAVARGITRFDGRSSFRTWAYRVATNACLDELRRRGRRPEPVDVDASREMAATEPGPAEQALQTELRDALLQVLGDLPEEFRIPVILRDVLDLDYSQIAETLQIPVGTVRSRLSRGRSRLADMLGPPIEGNQIGSSIVISSVETDSPAPTDGTPRP